MKTLRDLELTVSTEIHDMSTPSLPLRERTLRYTGSVTRLMNEHVLKNMTYLLDKSDDEIGLFVTSPGGATGTAMSFFDTVRHILKPRLVTIGSGDVDSSGVILFLSGERRYITARTTVLLHPAGRVFGSQRYTTREMEAMLAEDRQKDEQYASLVADSSKGILTTPEVLALMDQHTLLTPARMLELGLADAVLP
jgi:ATP-dependent protease ClpP protease subunit